MKTKGRRQSKNIVDQRGKSDRLVPKVIEHISQEFEGKVYLKSADIKRRPTAKHIKMTGVSESSMEKAAAADRKKNSAKNPFDALIKPGSVYAKRKTR